MERMGKSPTCELLYDWGTTNCTVADLVELLLRNQFLAPASLLLPGNPPLWALSAALWGAKKPHSNLKAGKDYLKITYSGYLCHYLQYELYSVGLECFKFE